MATCARASVPSVFHARFTAPRLRESERPSYLFLYFSISLLDGRSSTPFLLLSVISYISSTRSSTARLVSAGFFPRRTLSREERKAGNKSSFDCYTSCVTDCASIWIYLYYCDFQYLQRCYIIRKVHFDSRS